MSAAARAGDGHRRRAGELVGLQSRTILRPLPFGPRSMNSGTAPSRLEAIRRDREGDLPRVVAVVGHAQRHIDGVGVRNLQRQFRIEAERHAGFDRLGDGADAAVECVARDEHLIAGDVVGKLELDRRLAVLRQHEHRVPVDGFGEVATDLAEGGIALVGVLAHDERRDHRLEPWAKDAEGRRTTGRERRAALAKPPAAPKP